jgi:mono/diheme cytochrome c family protein
LVYIPAHTAPFAYTNVKDFKYRPGGWNPGTDILANALPDDAAQIKAIKAMYKGQLIAWDPVAGKARWTVEHPFFWNGGILSTAGGLVFQGAGEGDFVAYEAATGKKLWSLDTGNGIVAAPSTYELDGQQYVALMVGYGGAGPTSASIMLKDRPRLAGRLMVFKLGGKATAKPYVIPEIPALDLTQVTTGSGDAKNGFALYHENCQVCHGPSVSGTYLPDLRKSQMITTAENFKSVVLEGARKANGMASFARFLNAADAEDLRAYILKEAHNAQADAAAAKVASAK